MTYHASDRVAYKYDISRQLPTQNPRSKVLGRIVVLPSHSLITDSGHEGKAKNHFGNTIFLNLPEDLPEFCLAITTSLTGWWLLSPTRRAPSRYLEIQGVH